MPVNSGRESIDVEAHIIDHFNRCVDYLPGNKDVQSVRKKAIGLFQDMRLPSHKIEHWHYTNLRTLLKSFSNFSEGEREESVSTLSPEHFIFSINNGKTFQKSKIPGVFVECLSDALNENYTKISDQVVINEDFIGQLNAAFVTDGWIFKISENTKLETPIELQNIQMGGRAHIFSDFKIGKNSQIVIVERQIGNDERTFVSSISSLHAEAYSDITWILIRDRGFDSTQFSRFYSVLEKNAKLTLYVINVGSQLNRQEIDIELRGEESNFQLRSINLLSGKTHSDLTMVVRHSEQKSTSKEVIRNVVVDRARGIFQGMIRVAQRAQKTDARMACNSLVLSDDAEFDAKPELEIFADDVVCGHGATATSINSDHLFYLMARGIPFKTAHALLIKGFVSELINDIEQSNMQSVLEDIVSSWLEKNV